ncbi:MAG: AIR synthase related protein [Patescibacteria group bacterium]
MKNEYALAGVNYRKIDPFKHMMQETGKRTLRFPNRRGVFVVHAPHAHGAMYRFSRWTNKSILVQTTEGLGNKNWISEWMYQHAGTGRTYYEGIGIDAALMAVNDLIAQGAMPFGYTDEVAAGDSEWFSDKKRAKVLAESFYQICKLAGMALPAGESPSLRYLIKAEPPVKSAPSLSGCALGIITNPKLRITGKRLRVGDVIIGATSSGVHANGISLIIKRALTLQDQFLTKLPNGNTLGDETLIPTRSYVAWVEKMQEYGVDIHALAPMTGDGVSKMAFDQRSFTYVISKDGWPKDIPLIFRFMRELGVDLKTCLKTFNWGIGYCAFVPRKMVNLAIDAGVASGYEMFELGKVVTGRRGVIFGPEKNRFLRPPGK